ncbi:MAG: twin-arginine translocase subunit TatC [Chloroflexi bacterium]|nr:twin-arginine translocase subunit TatC [Chloroflexota bacterium]MDA1240105.1 twin-arginine translocase subunit TatC [Chloroflexota bacterium]MQC25397.1 twin-arginine translocase subunit TatC [Chloroflexota bacterium]MQC48198.1 twin-arginine translocase subunit TatC [Chloroflexota bacterium]
MTSDTDQPEVAGSEPKRGGEMTLMEHLLELRKRITWIAITVFIGMGVFFIPPIGFRLVELLLQPARQSIPDFRPQFIEPMENILVYFRVALLGGVTAAMPMIVFQVLGFVSPALTPQEKRWVFPIVAGATLSFLAGLAFCYFLVLPFTLDFLLTFGEEFAEADWRIGNYIDFVTRMLLVLGLVFQTPLIIMSLAKFRVLTARQMLKYWRFAVVAAFIIAAIVTPTIDPVTQSLVGGPIIILYFVGIFLAWLVRRE